MFKKILLVLVLLIIGFCGYVATLPSEYRYESARTIAAPADVIFAQVNTQKNWEVWSPWAKVDPNATFTYEGPDSGVGSVGAWDGNMEIGKGKSTIIKSVPNEHIVFKMEFLEPMAGNSESEFVFEPADGGTRVTWAMYGTSNFFEKALGVVMDCKTMVEEKFSEGLASLDTLVTTETAVAPVATEAAVPETTTDEEAAKE